MAARVTRSTTATNDAGSRRSPSSPRAVAGADLDNDSHGGIPLTAEFSNVDAGLGLILADPNRQFASDVVVSSPGGFGVLPFDPSAWEVESPNEFSAGATPDSDGDRRLDVVTTNVVGNTIGFFFGHGRCGLPSGRRRPFAVDGGIRKRGLFFVQGFIENAAAPSGDYAVTNGILVDSR